VAQRPTHRPRIVLADDYQPMMQALRRLLSPAYDVVGQVTDGGALLEAVLRLQPDLVIVDLQMPTMSGLEACRRIKLELPQTRIIVLSAAPADDIAESVLANGASAFVEKYRLADDLLPAVERSLA
jgi:two-component system secretion response regulator SsrB